MGTTQLRTGWSTLVQSLVDSEGPGVRARILLECIAREPWVRACALWRQESAGGAWTCILTRGTPDELPPPSFLADVAQGRVSADLLPGRGVLISGKGPGALALAYAGTPEVEGDLDLVSGLLHVARLVDSAEMPATPAGRVEAFVPALPRAATNLGARRREEPDCQPASLLEQIARVEAEACARAHLQFEYQVDPEARERHLRLSPAEFGRAVGNLLANAREALEHTQEGGRIRVQLHARGPGELVLEIEDSGPGLPRPVLEALTHGHPEDLPGPGLGLAVSWGIVQSAGGELSCCTGTPHGTRFELRFPVAIPS